MLDYNSLNTIDLSKNTKLNTLTLLGNNFSSKPQKCINLGDACSFGYVVRFNSNGGSSVPVQNGYGVNEPANPTKSGYAFVGWYKDKALTQPVYFPLTVDTNTTLYAKWSKKDLAQEEEIKEGEGLNKNIIIGIVVIVALAVLVCLGGSSSKTTTKKTRKSTKKGTSTSKKTTTSKKKTSTSKKKR